MTTQMAEMPAEPRTIIGWVGGSLVFDLVVRDCPLRFREARDRFEREYLLATLRLHGGNISRTADAIRVSRRHLRTRIVALGIDVRAARVPSSAQQHTAAESV